MAISLDSVLPLLIDADRDAVSRESRANLGNPIYRPSESDHSIDQEENGKRSDDECGIKMESWCPTAPFQVSQAGNSASSSRCFCRMVAQHFQRQEPEPPHHRWGFLSPFYSSGRLSFSFRPRRHLEKNSLPLFLPWNLLPSFLRLDNRLFGASTIDIEAQPRHQPLPAKNVFLRPSREHPATVHSSLLGE